MSGVLERMVQRSRGSLPAIEPLVRAQQTAAAALPLVAEENAATVLRVRNVASAGRERALRDELAGAARDDVRRDPAQGTDVIRKDSRRSETTDEVARVNGTAATDGKPTAKDADQDRWTRAQPERTVELRDVARESEEPHESSIAMRAEKMPAKPEETAGESIRTTARVELRASTQDTSAVRNEANDAALAMDAAEHTEIHITIGSVELRGPRIAPAPPKAPPFRPRVTLDEFLKRGTGSGGSGARS
jgi:hypothetical protein